MADSNYFYLPLDKISPIFTKQSKISISLNKKTKIYIKKFTKGQGSWICAKKI